VFLDMCTQWRWTGGMEPRRAGFDMGVFPIVCDGLQIPRKQRPEVYRGLKAMEGAALEVMNS
jgi:hypothetical protein